MPLILPGNVASATADTAFSVDNSCRFNGSDSYLKWRDTGQGGSQKLNSISLWCKKCSNGVFNPLFLGRQNGDNFTILHFDDDDRLDFYNEHGNAIKGRLRTNRKFRDPSAWYHILAIWDSGNGTAGNRMRLYVNGAEETSFETDTNPDEDQDSWFFLQNIWMYIGYDYGDLDVGHSSAKAFDGYIAQVLLVDGVIKGPTDMGEFDEDSPTIWKPKDISGEEGTGTNGALLLFEDSSDLGANEHGASAPNDDWTSTNLAAVDQATDSPTNNFCTLNSVDNFYITTWGGFSEGNTKATTSSTGGNYAYNTTTIGLTAGKWYWEQKIITESATDHNNDFVGVTGQIPISDTHNVGDPETGYGYLSNGNTLNDGTPVSSWGDTFRANDILSVALDLDNLKLYFAKNGTWQDSGDPTSGATGTGAAYTVIAPGLTPSGAYFPTCGDNAGDPGTYAFNFGNPSYANSSDAADANGYGAFEYAPPSGYLAICTKNLGSDGG